MGLNQEEKSILDDFVDNCIGNNEEGYLSNSEYLNTNKNKIVPIFRKMKEQGEFSCFVKLLNPFLNTTVANLLCEID